MVAAMAFRAVFGQSLPAIFALAPSQCERLLALARGERVGVRDVTLDALARRLLARWDAETRCQVLTEYGASVAGVLELVPA
jgi:hypothetical protein